MPEMMNNHKNKKLLYIVFIELVSLFRNTHLETEIRAHKTIKLFSQNYSWTLHYKTTRYFDYFWP